MSGARSGVAPDDAVTGSWASEALPMSVRKELLERELRKLGFRRMDGQRPGADATAQQQQSQASQHPQAGASDNHAD